MEQAVKTAWQRWIPESEQGSLGANPTLPAIMEHLGISGPDNSNGRIVYHHDAAGSPDQSPSSSSRSQNSTSKANRKSRKGSTSQMPNGERIFSSPPQDDEADHLPQTWSPSFAIDESSPGAYNMVPDLSFATSPTSFSDPSYSRAGTVHPFHMTQGNSPTHWDNPFDVPMNGMSSTMPAPPSNAFGDQAYNQDGFTRGPPLRSSSMSGYKLPIYARRPAARPIAFTRGFHIDMSQMPKVLIESQSRESKTPSTTHDTAQFVQQPGPSHVMYPQLSR